MAGIEPGTVHLQGLIWFGALLAPMIIGTLARLWKHHPGAPWGMAVLAAGLVLYHFRGGLLGPPSAADFALAPALSVLVSFWLVALAAGVILSYLPAARLPDPATIKICPTCGELTRVDAVLCLRCGHAFEKRHQPDRPR